MILTKEQKRDVGRRLENWARWYYGGSKEFKTGPSDISPFPAYNLVNLHSPRSEGGNIPVLMGEGEDTDRTLRKMHPELTKALTVHYLTRGTPKDRAYRCRMHGCKPPSVRTYYRRVERAELVFIRLCYRRQDKESIGQFAIAA